LNHAIYFITDGDSAPPAGLWRTNGTAAGTWLVKGGHFNELVTAGGSLYLIDPRLWRSDGTTAGTKVVGSFDDSLNLTAVGSYVCFAGENPFQNEWRLWASNGTTTGTHQVRAWPGHDSMSARAVVGSRLYFAANDGSHGNELWKYSP